MVHLNCKAVYHHNSSSPPVLLYTLYTVRCTTCIVQFLTGHNCHKYFRLKGHTHNMFMTAIHVVVWVRECFVHYTELEHVGVASMVEEVAYHIIERC